MVMGLGLRRGEGGWGADGEGGGRWVESGFWVWEV